MKKTWKMILKSTFILAVVLLASTSVAALEEQITPVTETETVCRDLGIELYISRGKANTINNVKINGNPEKGLVSSEGMVFEINTGDIPLKFIIENYIEDDSPNEHNKMTFRVIYTAIDHLEVRFHQSQSGVFTAKQAPSNEPITVELEGEQSNNINFISFYGCLTVPPVSEPEVKDITANKVWVGGLDRPEVEFQLYRQVGDEEAVKVGDIVKINAELETPWSYTWKDQLIEDDDGNKYIYFVREVNVPENYQADDVDDLEVTNTYQSPLIDLTVKKVWVGGEEHPPISVQLFRDEVAFGVPVLLNTDNTYTWVNLPITNNDGIDYHYTVDEVEVPDGYAKTVDRFTITNTFISPDDPVDPEDPVDPVDPEDPIDPGDPIDPVDPEDPIDPVDPEEPVNPEDPDPVDPINPTDPVDPSPEPTLPVTGGSSLAALYGTGFAAIFTGTLLIKKKNKK